MRVYQKHAGDDAKLLIKFHWPNNMNKRIAGHISVLSEIHILFPFHLILTSGPILIAKNHQRVVLS